MRNSGRRPQTLMGFASRNHKLFLWRGFEEGVPSSGRGKVALVQSLSHARLFVTPWTAAHHVPCPWPSPGVCSNSCPLSWWCHPVILSSVVPFSSRLQFFPASGSSLRHQFSASGGQRTGASASASVIAEGYSPVQKNFPEPFPSSVKANLFNQVSCILPVSSMRKTMLLSGVKTPKK